MEVLAARTPRPQQTQLGLAVAALGHGTAELRVDFLLLLEEHGANEVVLLLLPAWRRYILATVISLEKERRQKAGYH